MTQPYRKSATHSMTAFFYGMLFCILPLLLQGTTPPPEPSFIGSRNIPVRQTGLRSGQIKMPHSEMLRPINSVQPAAPFCKKQPPLFLPPGHPFLLTAAVPTMEFHPVPAVKQYVPGYFLLRRKITPVRAGPESPFRDIP